MMAIWRITTHNDNSDTNHNNKAQQEGERHEEE